MTILLVDDQPNILSSLMTCIPWHKMGFTAVYTASCAEKARAIMQSQPLDLVILDIEMPREDGLSLLSWARTNDYDFECILLTAHADFFYAQQAITLNVHQYIIQPARNEDIMHAVESAIKKRQGLRLSHSDFRTSYGFKAQNYAIAGIFNSWPSYKETVINPTILQEKAEELSALGFSVDPSAEILLLYLHVVEWDRFPLKTADFIIEEYPLLDEFFTDSQGTTDLLCLDR